MIPALEQECFRIDRLLSCRVPTGGKLGATSLLYHCPPADYAGWEAEQVRKSIASHQSSVLLGRASGELRLIKS